MDGDASMAPRVDARRLAGEGGVEPVEFDGSRRNGLRYTRATERAARARVGEGDGR